MARIDMAASEFHAYYRFRCPACAEVGTASADEGTIRGSDLLMDQCEQCDAYLLIDQSGRGLAADRIGIASFDDLESAMAAARTLLAEMRAERG